MKKFLKFKLFYVVKNFIFFLRKEFFLKFNFKLVYFIIAQLFSFNHIFSQTYCAASGNTSYQTGAARVVLNTLDYSDADNTNEAYEDFTSSQSTTLEQDEDYDLSVYANTDGDYTDHVFVWIDWNDDGDFNDAGEEYDLGTAHDGSAELASACPYSITVPANANVGVTRMRVAVKYNGDPGSCETAYDGEVEDYGIVVQASCTPPSTQASSLVFSNHAKTSTTIDWSRGNGDNVLVVARAGSTPGDPVNGTSYVANTAYGSGSACGNGFVVYNGTGTTVDITNLTNGTNYYYNLYEYNNSGTCYNKTQLSGNQIAGWCIPTVSNTDESGINRVTFSNIDNTDNTNDDNSCVEDFTSGTAGNVQQSSSYNLTVYVNTNGDYLYYTRAFIDWNQDGDFSDTDENQNLGTISDETNSQPSLSPLSITVPSSAVLGNTLMRIGTQFNADVTVCSAIDWGEWEDYFLNVTSSGPHITSSASFSTFTSCAGSVSAEQSFTLSAVNISSGDLTVTAPTGYELCKTSGGSFTNSLTYTPSGGTVASSTVYIRLKSSASNGASGNISLTASGATQVDLATGSATVNALPTVTASVTETSGSSNNDGIVCATASVTLNGGGATSYTWDNGVTNGVGFTPSSTTYTVTGTDGNGCQNTAQQAITVNALPTAIASSSTSSICEGSTISLTGSATGGSSVYSTYSWTGPNSYNAPNTQNPTVSLSATTAMDGSYNLTVTDDNNCSSVANSTTISVSGNPTAAAAGDDISQCDNSTYTLAANSPSTGTGVWSLISGSVTIVSSSSNTSSVTGLSAGSSATLRWTTSNGVCASSNDDVVLTNYTLPTASVNSSTVCTGSNASVIATAAGGSGSGYSYSWTTLPVGVSNPGNVNNFSSPTAGTYGVTITDGNSCTSAESTGSVTLEALPTADAGDALTAICQSGTSAAMGGSVGGSATGGIWSGGSGTWTNSTNESTATYTADASEKGTITLTLTTTGSSVCNSVTDTKTISVLLNTAYVDPSGTDDESHGAGTGSNAFATLAYAISRSWFLEQQLMLQLELIMMNL